MKRLFVLLCVVASANASAQTVDSENYSVENKTHKEPTPQGFLFFNLAYGNPNAQYKKAMGNAAFGISTGFGVNPFGERRESPVLLGLDYSYYTFGFDETTDPVTDVPYITGFNTSFAGVLARAFPVRTKNITLFADGVAGLRRVTIRTKENFDTEEPLVVNKQNDRSFGYGVGVGFISPLVAVEEGVPLLGLTVRAMYWWGERSAYIKRDSLRVVDDVVTFDSGFTAVNMLQIQVGIIFY
jgi:hypothetical protein